MTKSHKSRFKLLLSPHFYNRVAIITNLYKMNGKQNRSYHIYIILDFLMVKLILSLTICTLFGTLLVEVPNELLIK